MNHHPLVSLLCLFALALPPTGAQETGDPHAKYDRIVTGALASARDRMTRASRLEDEARELEGRSTRRWLSLMASVKRNYRIAWLGLERYRDVDLSDAVRRKFRRTRETLRTRLIRIYEILARGHVLAGNPRAARRVFASLEKLDPKAAERLAATVRDRFLSREERNNRHVGVHRNIRAASRHRLTGYEIRWLARRGYLGPPRRNVKPRPPRVPRPPASRPRPGGKRFPR
jgi:hypothetical protein